MIVVRLDYTHKKNRPLMAHILTDTCVCCNALCKPKFDVRGIVELTSRQKLYRENFLRLSAFMFLGRK